MKRIGLLIVFAAIIGFAQAQTEIIVIENCKPEKGHFTTELQFAPFSDQPFSEMGLQGRVFFNKNWAFRLGLDLGFNGGKVVVGEGDTEVTGKTSYYMFGLAPGFEYHMGNWKRVSVYTGAELFFKTEGAKTTAEAKNYSYEEKNGGEDRGYYNSFGINALLGTDVYIVKGLYMGAELKLGYGMGAMKKGEESETISGTTVTNKYEDKSSAWNFGFSCQPKIRLGWRF